MKTSPCRDREKRCLGCHTDCPDYLQFKEKCEKIIKERKKRQELTADRVDRIRAVKKHSGGNAVLKTHIR